MDISQNFPFFNLIMVDQQTPHHDNNEYWQKLKHLQIVCVIKRNFMLKIQQTRFLLYCIKCMPHYAMNEKDIIIIISLLPCFPAVVIMMWLNERIL